MKNKNQIYNYNFRYGKPPDHLFPDGWNTTGGDIHTLWEWIKKPDNSGEISIRNLLPVKAGIRQEQQVYVPVGEKQRWLLNISLHIEKPAQQVYVRVFFSNPAGYPVCSIELNYTLIDGDYLLEEIVATPVDTSALTIEVGLDDTGKLLIKEVSLSRLYPVKSLRLDDKGRVFVNHVQCLDEIKKPVRLAGPVDVNPVKLKDPVKVDVTVKSNIRSLQYFRDSIRAYGSENMPLKTDSLGRLQVDTTEGRYTEASDCVVTGNAWQHSVVWDVSMQKICSFAVINTGSYSALVRTEISPNMADWGIFDAETEVQPGKMQILVPKFFLRYVRVCFRSTVAGKHTSLTVWHQAQS